MLATVNIGIGCCLVGLFQLVIGGVIHLGRHHTDVIAEKEQRHNYGVVYVIIAIFGIVAMVLTFVRAYFTQHRSDEEQKEFEMKEMSDKLI